MFKLSQVRRQPKTKCLADKGYQGIQRLHGNSCTPQKKSRGKPLSAFDRWFNQELAELRVVIEQVNRCLKVFKILSERYRNRRQRFGLRFNLIAGLYKDQLCLTC